MVHSIGFAPESCLGGDIMRAPWEDVATAVQVSAYSLRVLADVALPLMEKAGGGSIVGLDFDNCHPGVPGLRLDGRRQGGPGGDRPATWPATSARRASGSTSSPPARSRRSRRRRSPASSASRTAWQAALAARLGRRRPRAGRPGRRRPAVGLVPRHHRRGRPRRRRLPRHRRVKPRRGKRQRRGAGGGDRERSDRSEPTIREA